MKNPQRNTHHHHLISSRYESLPPMSNNSNFIHKGILCPPNRSVSFSLPPYPISVSYFNLIHQLQPPLLPLPDVKPCNNMVKTKGDKKTSKSAKKPTGKPTSILRKAGSSQDLSSKGLLDDSSKIDYGLELSTSDLSREFSKTVLLDLEKFSGSFYADSPPPSSLPLPKFTIIRPSKISCKAEAAAEVDSDATHDLRRLLRLP